MLRLFCFLCQIQMNILSFQTRYRTGRQIFICHYSMYLFSMCNMTETALVELGTIKHRYHFAGLSYHGLV